MDDDFPARLPSLLAQLNRATDFSRLNEHVRRPAAELEKHLRRVENAAELAYKKLVREIRDFEGLLDDEHTLGARLVNAPGEGTFHVDYLTYRNPDLIILGGLNADGLPIRIVQHVSQLCVSLTALPKRGEEPRRIGF